MDASVLDLEFSEPRLAALYDRLYPLAQPERDFYLPMILAAPAALDVGCGTGALLKEARRAGHLGRLCGLDPAAAMLAEGRRQGDIDWLLGSAASMRFEREFDLVVMTGHAFQALLTDEELHAAVAAVRRALHGGGRFVFDTRNPAARAWERWNPQHALDIEDAQGNVVRVTAEVVAGYDGRTVTFVHSYRCAQWSGPLTSRSELRFLGVQELGGLLRQAGFTVEAQFGDFDRSPLTQSSPEIVTIAR